MRAVVSKGLLVFACTYLYAVVPPLHEWPGIFIMTAVSERLATPIRLLVSSCLSITREYDKRQQSIVEMISEIHRVTAQTPPLPSPLEEILFVKVATDKMACTSNWVVLARRIAPPDKGAPVIFSMGPLTVINHKSTNPLRF